MIVLVAPVTLLVAADLLKAPARWIPAARIASTLGLAVFILLRPVHADAFIPDPARWQTARNLNAFVGSLDGGLLAPQMAFLPARNHQTNQHWHRMGHADLTWSNHVVDEDWAVLRTQARYALLNRLDYSDFGHAIRRQYRFVGYLPDDRRVHMMTGGGVVDLNQLWERLPAPGDAPAPH
ncbi:MAG: hypothetical protein QM736_14050 [Vicinamibacterales bacterium]